MKKLIKLLMIFAFAITVCSCGKMASPVPIEGSGYPHKYPKS
jgi:hypothetical protein